MRPAPDSPRSWKLLRLAAVLVAAAAFVVAARWVKSSGLLAEALRWIQSLGPWAPVVFVALYVFTVIICLPAAILTAGGGFLFGFGTGALYVLLAAVIASHVTFLLARHLARGWITRRFGDHPRFRALDEAVAAEGWKIVALMRLAPVFPFSITSYAFGLTRVPWGRYFIANFTLIPGTLLYVYLGSIARDVTDQVSTPLWIKGVIFAVALLVVLYLARFARRALKGRLS